MMAPMNDPGREPQDLAQSDAQKFLAANKILPVKAPKPRSPVLIYLAVAIFAFLVVAGVVIATRPAPAAGPGPSNILSVPTPNNAGTQGLDNQTKQKINKCSNTLTAVSGQC
jgi:hypothetical protein